MIRPPMVWFTLRTVRANLSQREPAFPGEADDCCSDTHTFLDVSLAFLTSFEELTTALFRGGGLLQRRADREDDD